MAVQSFKELLIWQKARELNLDIYDSFSACADYAFKDQIQRASLSIMNNFAEGYGRRSDKAFLHFLIIARGSTAEVESMLMTAVDLKYISLSTHDRLIGKLEEIAKMLSGFIKRVRINSRKINSLN